MVEIDVFYEGGLQCTATHGPSKSTLQTDAPLDNGGKGAAFSPTDLAATALATCIATTMDLFARRHGLDLTGVRVHTTKEMSKDAPRRIVRLATTVTMPIPRGEHTAALEQIAHTCPVAQSLHPSIEIPVEFRWPD